MIRYLILCSLLWIAYSCKENKQTEQYTSAENIVTLPYFNTPDFTPDWAEKRHRIPPFSLVNQQGDTITNTTYTNKIYVANFFFTVCPSICPRLTESMAGLQKKYSQDGDISLVSHSVMPWHDTVEKLAQYAETNGVNHQKWNLLTGTKEAIYDLARNGYFADEDFGKKSDEDNFIHTENFILVDKEGYIRGVYNGTLAIDMKRLSRHIELLKNEYEL